MAGAIAAGHPLTAEAGARVLRAGGHAVDAAVAAAFVSWVCESPLTGPGGGGFMLVHDAGSAKTTVLDFFVDRAARGSAPAELLELAVDFDGDTQQLFRTGSAAVAVPGTAKGLEEAHRRWGRVPWQELVAPAAALARDGFELTPSRRTCTRFSIRCFGTRRKATRCTAATACLRRGRAVRGAGAAATLDRLAARGVVGAL